MVPDDGVRPPRDNYILADELALVTMESGLVAVERDGLEVWETMNLDRDLTHWGATLMFSIASENVAMGLRDVSHNFCSLATRRPPSYQTRAQ
jgi:hypothetical protein